MAAGGRSHHGRSLAVGLALLGGVVAALVARAAVTAGSGTCSGEGGTGADVVCLHLVRVLGLRMGIAVGVATVIVVLMVIGVSRVPASASFDAAVEGRPRQAS